MGAVKEALKGTDSASIKSASEKLNEAWQSVSAELYKAAAEKAKTEKAQSGGPAPAEGGTGKEKPSGKEGDGPIIDAEVVNDK